MAKRPCVPSSGSWRKRRMTPSTTAKRRFGAEPGLASLVWAFGFVWDYVPVWLRLFGTTSLFEPSALFGTSFLFGTTSLFGCAFKPSNKTEGSNFQTSPKGSNQAAMLLKQSRRLKQPPKGSNHQRKIAQIVRFFSFFLHICKKKCIFAR